MCFFIFVQIETFDGFAGRMVSVMTWPWNQLKMSPDKLLFGLHSGFLVRILVLYLFCDLMN